jgi:hypothetical protein
MTAIGLGAAAVGLPRLAAYFTLPEDKFDVEGSG